MHEEAIIGGNPAKAERVVEALRESARRARETHTAGPIGALVTGADASLEPVDGYMPTPALERRRFVADI